MASDAAATATRGRWTEGDHTHTGWAGNQAGEEGSPAVPGPDPRALLPTLTQLPGQRNRP